MAVKTITIDTEAYEALARHKKPGQSFSQVIKMHFGRLRKGRDLKAAVKRATLSEETLEAVDRLVANRQSSVARSEPL
jgi:predicted CopG family antitoxin